MLFVEYPKCSTCRKAKKWLDDHGFEYIDRHIVEQNLSAQEIRDLQVQSGLPISRLINTSGKLYREMGLSKKLPIMSNFEIFTLLGSNGMLVKRPILVEGDTILVGFKEAEWEAKLLSQDAL